MSEAKDKVESAKLAFTEDIARFESLELNGSGLADAEGLLRELKIERERLDVTIPGRRPGRATCIRSRSCGKRSKIFSFRWATRSRTTARSRPIITISTR
jgi:hypothetical protein